LGQSTSVHIVWATYVRHGIYPDGAALLREQTLELAVDEQVAALDVLQRDDRGRMVDGIGQHLQRLPVNGAAADRIARR
jgi:hypothetical protein